jgi:hypothetical protein
MKYLISGLIIFSILIVVDRSFGYQLPSAKDSIYIKLPIRYDTLNVSFIGSDFRRIVFDKFSQKSYTAPEGTSLDVQRVASFAYPEAKISPNVARRIIGLSALSDSLLQTHRSFFRNHTFFVIITRSDTCYFYKAKGEYMYKNYENDVK